MAESAPAERVETAAGTATVCVVGLGYVGVPLALAFDEEGFDVLGFDVDGEKVDALSDGTDVTGDHGDAAIADSDVQFTTDPMPVEQADYVVITVPTPVDETGNPDLTFVKSAGRTVGEHLSEGAVVVLESTVYPGVTREVLAPAIEEASGLTLGEGFHLGYSPERLSPGEEGRGLRDVTKIVSGSDDEVLEDVAKLYERVVDAGVYRAPSIETAEAAKVIENVQRDLNIAIVNELAIVCEHMDLETDEVLDAAGTKWNFHDYSPGLVGGHCIPVDPLYLAHGAESAGYKPDLILKGREVNEYMPKHTAELAMKALNAQGKVLRECDLLVLGLAYKPNVGDIRTSEVNGIVAELDDYGIDVAGYDPLAPDEKAREHFNIEVQEQPDLSGFDGVILATAHETFFPLDFEGMAERMADDPVLVDVLGATDEERAVEAGFRYEKL